MNFDKLFNRYDSDSVRYDQQEGVLPLTIADTDFPTDECVNEAMQKRLSFPLFGYVKDNLSWRKAVGVFYAKRFGLSLSADELAFSSGVLSSVTAFLLAFSKEGDGIILLSPIYNAFYSCISHTGRKAIEVPLIYDGSTYEIDFEKLEESFENHKAMILCSPHNPVGKSFSEEELKRIFLLAKKHGVIILSDEIHGLVSSPGKAYLPSLCLEEAKDICIMAASPSKAFNTAGLQAAFIASKNPILKKRIEDQLGYDDCGEPNSFALPVLEAIFLKGESYLEEFNAYVKSNKDLLYEGLSETRIKPIRSDFTYLVWLDCSSLSITIEDFLNNLKKEGLSLSLGSHYGLGGECFLRMNVATPRSNIEKAILILKKVSTSF